MRARGAGASRAAHPVTIGKTVDDTTAMQRAIEVAWTARLRSSPNPWVGCVIECSDGRIVEGATERPGGRHAEMVALDSAGTEGAKGSTLWVTLEPCSHVGRTGACARSIIDAGVARVVVALEDPDPKVSGKGIAMLVEAGIDVVVGEQQEVVRAQLAPYLKHRQTGLPWVVLKMASTLDGRSAAPDGSSQWITGGAARADAHQLRAESDAIVVGAGTIRADDPSLTVRHVDGPDPLRVVLGSIPANARVQPAIEHQGDLQELLVMLGERGVLQVLVEGGAGVAGGFHREGLVDHYVIYIAPALFGGDDARAMMTGRGASTMEDLWRGAITKVTQLGGDLRIDLSPITPSQVTGPVPVVRLEDGGPATRGQGGL